MTFQLSAPAPTVPARFWRRALFYSYFDFGNEAVLADTYRVFVTPTGGTGQGFLRPLSYADTNMEVPGFLHQTGAFQVKALGVHVDGPRLPALQQMTLAVASHSWRLELGPILGWPVGAAEEVAAGRKRFATAARHGRAPDSDDLVVEETAGPAGLSPVHSIETDWWVTAQQRPQFALTVHDNVYLTADGKPSRAPAAPEELREEVTTGPFWKRHTRTTIRELAWDPGNPSFHLRIGVILDGLLLELEDIPGDDGPL